MHNTPVIATPKAFDLMSSAFLPVAFLAGIADALQTPTLSSFPTDEVHARPDMARFFFAGSVVTGILASQLLTGCSDRKDDRKNLIVFCCMLGMLACVLFVWNHNYFISLFVGVFLSSFGSTANPQMFALVREHADHTGQEIAMFGSMLRAQVLSAQAIGPPLTYALVTGFSFTVMYLSATVVLVICGVMVWLLLPPTGRNVPPATDTVETPRRNRHDMLLLFVICTLMRGVNSLYIIDVSLFIINELHLPEKLAGIMTGTAAGLEVPTMLIVGYFVKRLGKRLLIRTAVVAGFFFYAGMLLTHSPAILLGLQLLSVIYIGILDGISMLYFQDLMLGQTGSVTILYTNTIRVGWTITGSLAGIAAEIWGYHAVFWFVLVMIVTTVACLVRIKDV